VSSARRAEGSQPPAVLLLNRWSGRHHVTV
jgi:hypothetical protein